MSKYLDIRYLIQELVYGKEEAWCYFLKKYGQLIYFCINKVTNYHVSPDNLEDCFQEILRILLEDDCLQMVIVAKK